MTDEIERALADFTRRYKDDPVGYALAVHGRELDLHQQNVARAVAAGDQQITWRSGHGVGKTTTLAEITNWFCNTRWPWKVVCTAPTTGQLYDALWPEIKASFKALPDPLRGMFDVTAERIVLLADPENCFITPRTSSKERPEALAGIHSKHVLLIADEASGIPDEVFVSAQGSMSTPGACTVLTGNPTRRSGFFYRTHTDPGVRNDWKRLHTNSETSAFVDRKFVQKIERMYGRDSNEFRVRVLGEFPLADDESLISPAWVDAAMERDMEIPLGRPVWTIDPARFGRDRTTFCERHGHYTKPITVFRGKDTMSIVGEIKFRYDCLPIAERPEEIIVDVIGIGAGIVDRGFEMGLPMVPVNVAEAATISGQGVRLRDDLWLAGRDYLEKGLGKLPLDPELRDELSLPTYSFTSDGRYKIESKDEMRKRGMQSPDKADCWLLTFASNSVSITGNKNSSWNREMKSKRRAIG